MSKGRAVACLKSLFLKEGPNDVFHIVDAESKAAIYASTLNRASKPSRTPLRMRNRSSLADISVRRDGHLHGRPVPFGEYFEVSAKSCHAFPHPS
jgi:hypothetical protein